MTVWALSEAKEPGLRGRREIVGRHVKWTKERLADIDKPRDTRPGWNMVSTPASTWRRWPTPCRSRTPSHTDE